MQSEAKVLIVEDDAVMLRGLKDNFEYQGYQVTTAANGEKGLELALSLKPDLIILDLMMPGMNGYEVCQSIREAGLEMPILMLTAKSQESDIVMGLKLGADDYVTKPFGIRELLARAETMLRRTRKQKQTEHTFGDCKLLVESRQFFRSGEEVELSPKEFKLLEFFLEHQDRALSRDWILNQVWGHDVYVTDRTVDRFVTTLRNKIEPNPKEPQFLRTVREVGYKFTCK
ncbi:MAG: response regulator transcription factor [Verrucomicrobia bacterium]|nr:response regulator transcription factor [Verrucomicrobiota bacterium]